MFNKKENPQMAEQREKFNAMSDEEIAVAISEYEKILAKTHASADRDLVKVYYEIRGGTKNV